MIWGKEQPIHSGQHDPSDIYTKLNDHISFLRFSPSSTNKYNGLQLFEDFMESVVLRDDFQDAMISFGKLMKNPVSLENDQFELIASMNPQIEGNPHQLHEAADSASHTTAFPTIRGLLKLVQEWDRPCRFLSVPELGMLHNRIIARIQDRDGAYGYLYVTEQYEPLDQGRIEFIHLASLMLSHPLRLHQDGPIGNRNILLTQHVHDLITNNGNVHRLIEYIARLGYNLENPHHLLFIQFVPNTEHIHEAVKKAMAGWPSKVSASTILVNQNKNNVMVLFPCSHQSIANGTRCCSNRFNEFYNELRRIAPHCQVIFAIGGRSQKPEDYAGIYQRAGVCLTYATNSKATSGPIYYEELEILGAVVHSDTQHLSRLNVEFLRPLLEVDRKTSSFLVTTTTAFFEKNESLKDTALALFVHINTVRYRLKKVEEIYDDTFKNPLFKFQLQLALQLHKLLPQHRHPPQL
ncbi:MAG: helix-turn-helix domain-containing protein [Firmicutes bacterium]|nr:helix-turn-helix domain-containing protein [Bacillota bacterium]